MKLLIALVLSTLSGISFAAHGEFTITSLGISDSSKTIYIGVTPPVENSTCSNNDQLRISIRPGDSDINKEVYSASLVAITTDRKIEIDYDENQCLFDAVKIGTFSIK